MVVDKSQARKLALFVENDYNLYKSMVQPLQLNYAKKKLKKTYTKKLALKGIMGLVEAGRRKYIREYGSLGGKVSLDTKKEVAKQLYEMINEGATYEAKRLRKQMSAKKKLKKKSKK